MSKQIVEITIKKDGTSTLKAVEGFAGENCREQTKDIEIILGGEQISTKNTEDFYKDSPNINIDISNNR